MTGLEAAVATGETAESRQVGAVQSPQVRGPRLLDVFCCAGGAAKGYHRAGFDRGGRPIRRGALWKRDQEGRSMTQTGHGGPDETVRPQPESTAATVEDVIAGALVWAGGRGARGAEPRFPEVYRRRAEVIANALREAGMLRVDALREAAAFVTTFDQPQEHWKPENRCDRATVRMLAKGLRAMADSAERRAAVTDG